jgi:hypothetical protein
LWNGGKGIGQHRITKRDLASLHDFSFLASRFD